MILTGKRAAAKRLRTRVVDYRLKLRYKQTWYDNISEV
jgi:hypothetical protein